MMISVFQIFFFQAQQTSNNRKKSEKKMVKCGGGRKKILRSFLTLKHLFGEKKRLSNQMAKQYSPSAAEKSYVLFFF